MERLGLGPDTCADLNARLVYTRVTGWGQTGPLRNTAGHDLNYIALSGMLAGMGRPGTPPNPPLNLVGDFGGGGLLAAFGTVCALLETAASGKGQVIDAAMLDGTNLLGAMVYGVHAMGFWGPGRGSNWLDGAAPYYDCYECADGRFVALAAIEPAFWRLFLDLVGNRDQDLIDVSDKAEWPRIKAALIQGFLSRTRDEWCTILEGTDACFAPVLEVGEAPSHPQTVARDNFSHAFGVTQPSPAPRFSRTPGGISSPPPKAGADAEQIVKDWGLSDEDLDQLRQSGVI
jgi:alpha-methylacyl-CoA racemase